MRFFDYDLESSSPWHTVETRAARTGKKCGMAKSPSVRSPRFSQQARVVLPGSEKAAPTNAVHVKATPGKAKITVSLVVRRKEPLKINKRGGRAAGPVRVSRAEYKKHHIAAPADLQLVRVFARQFNLTVETDPTAATRRTVQLTGSAADIQEAFGVELNQKNIDGVEYRVREGNIQLPAALSGVVLAVMGLDNRPQAKPHFRVKKLEQRAGLAGSAASAPSSYTPPQVAEVYQWPANATGAGQTIGIIELGGGYRPADLKAYFKSLGVPAPAITAVNVDKAKNAPTTVSSADGEVMLDIEVAASVAPGAKIVVYFTPNTDQGFTDAITTAVHDTVNKPSVISLSWGAPEANWTAQAMTALDAACQSAAALGVTITVAAGDDGSTDGLTGNNVDFPASSPHVLSCGGTSLDSNGSRLVNEVVWNDLAENDGATGGGVSNFFALPSWQANANVPAPSGATGGRGVPDVSGDADPYTGYQIRVDGQTTVIAGTSAVAPLWAGLVAVANQQLGTQVGFLQPAIYAAKAASAFNDVTEGNNGAFSAAPGWDACTGLGSPIASKLIPLLAPATSKPTTPTTTPGKKKKKRSTSVASAGKKAEKTGAGRKSTEKTGKKAPASKPARFAAGSKSSSLPVPPARLPRR